jgi:hypothetical protein
MSTQVPERPTLGAKPAPTPASAPAAAPPPPGRSRAIGQPLSGLLGTVIVLAVAALLGLGIGAQHALESIGPWSTFCLPVLAVAALWWGGWPAASASRPVGGLVVTAIVVLGGLALTLLGQFVIGVASPAHLLATTSEIPALHFGTFPWAVPLAAFVFVTTLQFTFVCRKWPFAAANPVTGGFLALAASWVIGIGGYYLLANWNAFGPLPKAIGLRNPGGPIDALDLVGILLCVVIWQMAVFFLLEGYPVSKIKSNGGYLAVANAVTIGGGILTWLLLHNGMNRSVPQISAIAAMVVVGTLTAGLLFEGWPARLVAAPGARLAAILATAAGVAVVTGFVLRAIAVAATWSHPSPGEQQLWVAVTGLNFIGAVIIIHAAVWRRWPLPVEAPAA